MSLNPLIRLPMKSNSRIIDETSSIIRHSFISTRTKFPKSNKGQHLQFVVEAKGKRGMTERQFKRPPPPPLPKIEDDGNPRFVIFIRMANVCSFSYSLNLFSYYYTDSVILFLNIVCCFGRIMLLSVGSKFGVFDYFCVKDIKFDCFF